MAQSVNYADPGGIPASAEVLLAGAQERVSRKDPENPRTYWQVILEPLDKGDPLYMFCEREAFEEAALLLTNAGGKVKARIHLRVNRSGVRYQSAEPIK